MAKRNRTRAERRRAERTNSADRGASEGDEPGSGGGIPWSAVGWGAAGIGILVLLGAVSFTSGEPIPADPVTESLARANAGTDIEVYRGRAHTVYHSTPPLPTSDAPRADGQPTLIWFSATWCTVCERMEPFAHETASRFTDRVSFVEKSVDHDRSAASRYGVRGTPTFILIDASGEEISRFHAQLDPASFADAIELVIANAALG